MLWICVLAALIQTDTIIGVSAIHLESGRRIEQRAGERFPMGSVYKDGKQHVVVAIFTKTPKRAENDASREKEVADVARAVYDELVSRSDR